MIYRDVHEADFNIVRPEALIAFLEEPEDSHSSSEAGSQCSVYLQ